MSKISQWSGRSLTSIDYKMVDWSGSRKQDYRQHCIIDNFRDLFGTQSIQQDYWTICGANTIGGLPNEGSEIAQLTQAGLLTPERFHGVDRDPTIIEQNRLAYPDANWMHSDFVDAIHHNRFTPSLVHADTINMPELASELARGVIGRVEDCQGRIMVVFNVVIKRPVDKNRRDLIRFLQLTLNHTTKKWFILNEIYIYKGAVSTRSGTHLAAYTLIYDG